MGPVGTPCYSAIMTTEEEEEETYSSQHGATVTLTLEDGRLEKYSYPRPASS